MVQAPSNLRTRVAKCLGMLGSAHDGEVLNAARLADRLVRNAGLLWNDLLNSSPYSLPQIIYRDRIVVREKVVYRDKIVYRDKERVVFRDKPVIKYVLRRFTLSELVETLLASRRSVKQLTKEEMDCLEVCAKHALAGDRTAGQHEIELRHIAVRLGLI